MKTLLNTKRMHRLNREPQCYAGGSHFILSVLKYFVLNLLSDNSVQNDSYLCKKKNVLS